MRAAGWPSSAKVPFESDQKLGQHSPKIDNIAMSFDYMSTETHEANMLQRCNAAMLACTAQQFRNESEYATAVANEIQFNCIPLILRFMVVVTSIRVAFDVASFIADNFCTILNTQWLSPINTTWHNNRYETKYVCNELYLFFVGDSCCVFRFVHKLSRISRLLELDQQRRQRRLRWTTIGKDR